MPLNKRRRGPGALESIASFSAHRDAAEAIHEQAGAELFPDQEVERLRIAFDLHAKRDDGSIMSKDLPNILKTLFIVPTKSEASWLVSHMDPAGRGSIDFSSFLAAMTAFLRPRFSRATIRRAFYEISGGENRIDSDALQRVMVRLGQTSIAREHCEAMIREVDRTGSGFISLQDFYHLQTRTFDEEAP